MRSLTTTLVRITVLAVFLPLLMALAQPALATTESVLYNFANPPDAFSPRCNLVMDTAGNFYGTTFSGGTHNQGAVFKVTPSGTDSVVYSFAGGTTDGSHPIAGLVRDKKTGKLYGTTVYGGQANTGTVFVVDPATGAEAVLYSFKGGLDGANPYSSVVRSGTTIFGTTLNGGQYGYGTVFKLTGAGKETILHNFDSAFPVLDGSYPYAGLTLYKGILYGSTTLGGPGNLGTVFSITKTGSYAMLYHFKGGSDDGQSPYGGVTFDTAGNMWGTTSLGGVNNAGTIFEIPVGGVEIPIHHFGRTNGNGSLPYATMILYKKAFYGTTQQGGSANGGTVFKMTLDGTETVLHSFTGGTTDGFNPYGALVVGLDKAFYSTTLVGGTSNLGTTFRLVP